MTTFQAMRRFLMSFHLAHIEKGEGDYLILLHGNGEDSSYFANQLEPLSKFFHVIAVDTRGHGRTPRGDGDFSLERFRDDLIGFMDEKGIRKAHLLGFSDGANIALLLALSYPERVGKLILNGGTIFPMGLKPKVLNQIIKEWNIAKKKNLLRQEELLRLMVMEPRLRWEDLRRVEAECLVVVGSEDVIRASHSKRMAAFLKRATFEEIEGGHDIAFSNSGAFNEKVLSFLL